ncbi:MAG TPA: 30S ribosomal protein S12 methylthiotransferase RimO [Bacteroidaceae bacterium]|nr:30S ribosomal protein S12 methylthiotransferase RimO [Bacteroidaceae bacterium]
MTNGLIDIITLGCSKNLVDSEKLIRQLEAEGYSVRHDPEDPNGEYVVINTCGFISDAQEESIQMILECAELKKRGVIGKLFVMGCLSQLYSKELLQEIPDVDKYLGKFNWDLILTEIKGKWHSELVNERRITTPSHYAYLKIAEGCNRRCAFCAIPLMTGSYKSREIKDIVDEAHKLVSAGVKEIQLIAQDITYYGRDISGKSRISELVERISDIDGIEWIRLHYAYPDKFPYELLKVIRERNNVCNYLDIALQHINDNILKRMHRNISSSQTKELLKRIREEVPGIHLRTTLMVGFPGETDDDFSELVDFVEQFTFERMGAFAYSEVERTLSARKYLDDVPMDVKESRLSKLMEIQQDISEQHNQKKINHYFKTIIDRKEGDFFIGRTEFDSPEVDSEVLIKSEKELSLGSFQNVFITGAEAFDLYGVVGIKKNF